MSTARQVIIDLKKLGSPKKAQIFQRFFKTAPGQYGEGDKFLGLTTPDIRSVVKKFKGKLSLSEIKVLLANPFHECRTTALFLLYDLYQKATPVEKKKYVDFYLNHTNYINNWDLVDISAPGIIGDYLLDHDRSVLYNLARSNHLWQKRIAIISTLAFIKKGESQDTFKIAEILLHDQHDLIHKAVGWMLREIGKNSGQAILESFLTKHYQVMPRTMLRYAIEKFPEDLRQKYLKGEI